MARLLYPPQPSPAMSATSTSSSPAPLSRHLLLFLGAVVLTLAWELLGADLAVMHFFGSAQGFPLRSSWLMETLLHDDLRKLGVVLYALVWVWALWPQRWSAGHWPVFQIGRRERIWLGVLVTACLLAINLIKRSSATSCPWSLSEFGGVAAYVSHWNLWLTDGGPGHCFPGGHASSAFAFIGLTLPWLEPSTGPGHPVPNTQAWRWLGLIGVIGIFLGAVQTLRGAHYPSHTLWTLLICWGVSWALWRLGRPWLARSAATSPDRV